MINYICYIYQIDAVSSSEEKGIITIYTESDVYELHEVNPSKHISFIHTSIQILNSTSFYSYRFARNIFGEYITKYQDKTYVLVVMSKDLNKTVDLIDNIDFYTRSNAYLRTNNFRFVNNWAALWESKLIYLSEYSSKTNLTNSDMISYFNYFVFIVDSLIEYLKKLEKLSRIGSTDVISFCHMRVSYPIKKRFFYNPLSFIIDLEVRDVGEYIRSLYYNGQDFESELKYYLSIRKLSLYCASCLYSRIVFPSNFFDYFENPSDISYNRKLFDIDSYEKFIKKTYEIINSYVNIPNISWL